jgi:coenzyme PQQ precursor peptide PqqA
MIVRDKNSVHSRIFADVSSGETVAKFPEAGKRQTTRHARRGAGVPEIRPKNYGAIQPRSAPCSMRFAPPGRGPSSRSRTMRWSKPKIVELAVGLEINSYACAVVA